MKEGWNRYCDDSSAMTSSQSPSPQQSRRDLFSGQQQQPQPQQPQQQQQQQQQHTAPRPPNTPPPPTTSRRRLSNPNAALSTSAGGGGSSSSPSSSPPMQTTSGAGLAAGMASMSLRAPRTSSGAPFSPPAHIEPVLTSPNGPAASLLSPTSGNSSERMRPHAGRSLFAANARMHSPSGTPFSPATTLPIARNDAHTVRTTLSTALSPSTALGTGSAERHRTSGGLLANTFQPLQDPRGPHRQPISVSSTSTTSTARHAHGRREVRANLHKSG